MKNFTLIESKKVNHKWYGKGVVRVWRYNLTGDLLEEHQFSDRHDWMVNRGRASLSYWIWEFKRKYKAYKALTERR